MAAIIAIKGLDSLVNKLRAKAARAVKDSNVSVIVGYSTGYALFVHEDLSAAHGSAFNALHADKISAAARAKRRGNASGHSPWHSRGPNQQAKYLETPARDQGILRTMRQLLTAVLMKGGTMATALVTAGLKLQRASMEIVPVDTGILRASAFTKLETGS